MIRHYITIASRNFIKYKLQTLISVIGLAIGLVCFTYGMKWLEYETSYDGFYPKSEQMYTLYGINKQTGKKERKLPLVLARKLKQDFPEIKETALVYGNFGSTSNITIRYWKTRKKYLSTTTSLPFSPGKFSAAGKRICCIRWMK